VSIDALQAKYPLEIHWVQFPLHPETPPEGRALTDLFPGRDLTPMKERMRGLMQEAGLPYGDRSHTYNSRRAQELGKWADSLEESSLGEAYHKAMFHAYFVDGVNIYETDVLLGIVERAGLDRDAAQEVLDSGSFAAAVDADWHQSRNAGVTGVPSFVSRELIVVGCQPLDVLERFVQHLQQSPDNEPGVR
jgi:predicted DsbA family dithiol-disulfide isomerase